MKKIYIHILFMIASFSVVNASQSANTQDLDALPQKEALKEHIKRYENNLVRNLNNQIILEAFIDQANKSSTIKKIKQESLTDSNDLIDFLEKNRRFACELKQLVNFHKRYFHPLVSAEMKTHLLDNYAQKFASLSREIAKLRNKTKLK